MMLALLPTRPRQRHGGQLPPAVRVRFGGSSLTGLLRAVLLAALIVKPVFLHAQTDSPVPTVRCELDRKMCYEGDSVTYRVTVSNTESAAEPDLSNFDDFDVKSLGRRSQSSQSINIVNGRRSIIRRISVVYSYSLTPERTGQLKLPAPVVTVDGTEYRGNALTLRVVPPGPQNEVLCRILVEPRTVYPSQPFDVTLVVAVEALPDPLSDRDPVTAISDLANAQPALEIPWVDDTELPPGLSTERPWRDWIADYQTGDLGGFTINGLSTRSTFGLRPVLAAFLPESEQVTGRGADGRERQYWEYRIKRRFVADRVGDFTFGPARIRGQFVAAIGGPRPVLKSIYAIAPAETVGVVDVPLEGRPESYIGAIGEFGFQVDVTPRTARAGDPLTLVMTVRGEGNVDSIVAPNLLRMPEITEQFKLYDATTATQDDSRTFTMSIRPKSAEVREFPSVPIAYFDIETEEYVELASEPIPLDIAAATQFDDSTLSAIDSPATRGGSDFEVAADGIYVNITDLSQFQQDRVRPAYWWSAWTAMLLTYAGACSWVSRQRRRSPAQHRRQNALRHARTRLTEARDAWRHGKTVAASEQLAAAIRGLVADRADRDAETLTTRDILDQLDAWQVPPDVSEQTRRVLAACDEVRFAGGDSGAGLQADAEQLISDLAQAVKLK